MTANPNFWVAALARVKNEAEANERDTKEVSVDIRARMEAERLERKGRIIGEARVETKKRE